MNAVLDILLLLLAIAAVWKLRSVLGGRTGFERGQTSANDPLEDALIKKKGLIAAINAPPLNEVAEKAASVLAQFEARDKNFSVKIFLEGVRIAYKMIVEAFAKGDMEVLKNLTKQNVSQNFQAEIERRANKNHHANVQVKKIMSAKIIDAALKQNDQQEEAQITVEMKSHQITWTEDEEGRIIAGDPNTPRDMKDVWVFTRILGAQDPNWRLIATGA